jgi:predicted kinase
MDSEPQMATYAQLQALAPQPGAEPDWRTLQEAIPALAPLAGAPQDPFHHAEGDVWTHTRMVCEAMLDLPDYAAADPGRRFALFYAALLHDVAKPSCTIHEPDGRISSAGHSRRGAIDARILLWRAGTPFELRERVCRMIAAHLVPFYAFHGDRSGRSPEFIVRKMSCELIVRELAALAEADARGRVCARNQETLDNIELFRECAREEGCLDEPRRFPGAHTRLTYFRSKGAIAADYPAFQNPGSKAIMLAGLPASGKDTWIAANAPGLPSVSFDDAREELGLEYGEKDGAAAQLVLGRAKAFLRRHAPFVWNATHLSGQMRAKTLDLLFAYNAEVEIVHLESPEREIKARNARRDTSLTGAGIEKMLRRWEVPLPTEAHSVAYETDDGSPPLPGTKPF